MPGSSRTKDGTIAPQLAAAAAPRATAGKRGDRALALGKTALRALGALGAFLRPAFEDVAGEEAGILPDRPLDLLGRLGMLLEIGLGVLAALPDPLAVEGEPGARLLHDPGLDPEIDEFAGLGDTLA